MKKNILYALIAIGLCACAKDERLMYNEAPAIYFYKINGVVTADSTGFSFGILPVTVLKDSVMLSLKIMGKSENRDRIINIVAEEGATAKEGFHYKIGKSVMPAGAFETKVPVYIYRREIKDSTLSVMFTLKESADFKLGFPNNPGDAGKYDRLHYKVLITNQLLKPTNWETTWRSIFGDYSVVKYRFLIQVTGRTNWLSTPFPQDSRTMIQQARIALIEYRQANGPLIDENGLEVFFP